MNPIPHAVLVALAICNQHVTGWTGLNDRDICLHDTQGTSVLFDGCEAKPDGWEPGYESCSVIYEKTKAIREAEEVAKEKRREAAEEAKKRARAAKDQPTLQAALKALSAIKVPKTVGYLRSLTTGNE